MVARLSDVDPMGMFNWMMANSVFFFCVFISFKKKLPKKFAALRAAFFFRETRVYMEFTVLQAPQAKTIVFCVSANFRVLLIKMNVDFLYPRKLFDARYRRLFLPFLTVFLLCFHQISIQISLRSPLMHQNTILPAEKRIQLRGLPKSNSGF